MRSLDVPVGFRLASRLVFGVMRQRQPILGTELAGGGIQTGIDRRYPFEQIAEAHRYVDTAAPHAAGLWCV